MTDETVEILSEVVVSMRRMLVELAQLMSESAGIAGYHLSGNLATWDELELPGQVNDLADQLKGLAALLKGE